MVGTSVTINRILLGGFAVVALVMASCGSRGTSGDRVQGETEPPGSPPTTEPAPEVATQPQVESPDAPELRNGIPDVDMSVRIVELSDVHFDTFDGRSVPLDQTTIDIRRALLDAIRPLDNPLYEPAAEGEWLDGADLIIGFVTEGGAYAFPHKILNFHEIVNDEFDGVPVLISYCPLCRSGVVYDRRLRGLTLEFSNTSALYESDLVMVDRQTGSYWWQVPGRAIVGTSSGDELVVLPSVTTTWRDWLGLHPDTLVLSRDTGSPIDYTRDPFVGYQARIDRESFAFPVSSSSLDARLSSGTLVLGVEIGASQKVYPIELLGPSVVNDRIGDDPVAVFIWDGGGAVLSPAVGEDTLTFVFVAGGIVDEQTGTTWSREGLGLEGSLAGARLEPLPARSTFWFAYVGAFPSAEIYTR